DPTQLGRLVRGELDWIVMKALEKDRRRRYETASGLAADVERHLAGEAVTAVPPSAAYRVRKFVARYRAPGTAAAAVVLLLISATATSVWLYARAESQRRLADSREHVAQQALAEAENSRNRAEVAQRQAESERKAAEQARLNTEIELQRARLMQVQVEL